ncbi:putative hydrolase of the HAD superfamily [Flavobacteriaceae bacterium MAR_2009_75]|nr:putative hydrolase of the HAD superfamily [Flavobacteriaceae bacterium MAR_2009_75]
MDIKVNSQTVVVFDLDDTLYNELSYLQSAYREIALKTAPKSWHKLYLQMFSLYRCNENVFDFLAKNHNLDKSELITLYRNHKPKIALAEGVAELFQKLREKKAGLGLITDGRTGTQRAKLKALGIENSFDCIVISEEFGSEKPSEENYLAIENQLPEYTDFYYVADNVKKDFIAPNQLGWETIGVLDNGLNIHNDAHLYMTKKHLPKNYVYRIGDINII